MDYGLWSVRVCACARALLRLLSSRTTGLTMYILTMDYGLWTMDYGLCVCVRARAPFSASSIPAPLLLL